MLFERGTIKLVVADDRLGIGQYGDQRAVALLKRGGSLNVDDLNRQRGKPHRQRGYHLLAKMAAVADV